MRPAPVPSAALRAVRPAGPAKIPGVAGLAGPVLSAGVVAVPRLPEGRTGRVLAAGLALSALGHAALALWLVQASALPPPDGPDLPATEVSLLSGAQFSALTAPRPAPPAPAPKAPLPMADAADPMVVPPGLAAAPTAPSPALVPPPGADRPPDVAALAGKGVSDPQVAVLRPGLTLPALTESGAPVARPAPPPRAEAAPTAPEAPPRADAGPVASAAPLQTPNPVPRPKVAPPEAASPKAARTVASEAGDGGAAESTRTAASGSSDARDGWLSAIRARIERRKTYPAAAGGAEGRVTLQLTVDRAGRLTAVGVAKTSGHPVLDAAALRAVKSAGRFPKAPRAVAEASATFNLPLRFSAGS